MYVYFLPIHGFSDNLSRLTWLLRVCQLTNRTLLMDGEKGAYGLDFSTVFTFPSIINDSATINSIMSRHRMVVFPGNRQVTNVVRMLGEHPVVSFEDINFFRRSYEIFRFISFKPLVTIECARRRSFLPEKYIGIHVRNTDRKSNYNELYEQNKALIDSYPVVYLATDCEEALAFFKSRVNVRNFTAFPSDGKPLHLSGLSNTDKLMDMICDLYLIAMADKMLTNSKGGFTRLMGACNSTKKAVAVQFGSKTIM